MENACAFCEEVVEKPLKIQGNTFCSIRHLRFWEDENDEVYPQPSSE